MELLHDDNYFMKQALIEAQKAFEADEVPVGAVITIDNKIIARAHNLTQRLNDVTAHAEMQAITSAANYLNGKYLSGCTLYVHWNPALCVLVQFIGHGSVELFLLLVTPNEVTNELTSTFIPNQL